jgi:hypothetical protein
MILYLGKGDILRVKVSRLYPPSSTSIPSKPYKLLAYIQQDLHDRPLTFLNDNRPRRRYLYFRFIISYLNAKRRGMGNVTVPMETRKFWPSGGAYLHSSTLKVLARCVSGCELPVDMTSTQTFEATSCQSRDVDAGTTLAAGISTPYPPMREILLETMRFTPPGNALETSEDTALPSKLFSETSEEPSALSREDSPTLEDEDPYRTYSCLPTSGPSSSN